MKQSAVFALIAASLLQGPSPPASLSPDSASLTEGLYRNNYFLFEYRVPEHLIDNTEFFKQKLDERAGGPSQDNFLLLSAYDPTVLPKVRDGVVIMADRLAKPGDASDAEAYLQRLTRGHTSQGYELVQGVREQAVVGHKFFRADYKKATALSPLYMTALCIARRDYALVFVFTGGSQERIESLTASLNTLKFFPKEEK